MTRLIAPVLADGALRNSPQPTLAVNDRTILRPWSQADASVVVAAYADAEIQRWFPYSYDEQEAEAVIGHWNETWRNETGACWAVAQISDGAAFGRVAFQSIDFISGSAEIAYWLLPRFRGEGIASLAVTSVCQWAFDRLGLHRVELVHSVFNDASCRVAQRVGFHLEGTLTSECLYHDGWHDTHLHARVRK